MSVARVMTEPRAPAPPWCYRSDVSVRCAPCLALSVVLLGCGGDDDIKADKTEAGVDDGLRLVVGVGDKCLDANGTTPTDGARTILWSCHGGANQRWRLDPVTSEIRGSSGKCLDVAGAAGAGASVIVYTCHGGANQKWLHDPTTGQIKGLGGLCLDVEGGHGSDGAFVIAWTCHDGANQKWTLRR